MDGKPIRVLFICTGNSCRSQLAEALLRARGDNRYDVHSAGVIPSGVHPLVLQVLSEIGVHAAGQTSKHWNECLEAPPFDFVITLCDFAAQSCPVFPGEGRRLHWPFFDPVGARGTREERLALFRHCRDAVAERIRQFIEETT